MSSVGGPPPLPKLPVWDVVGLAYSDYFRHFVDVLRASWLWLILVAALYGVLSWKLWSLIGAVILDFGQRSPFPPFFDPRAFLTIGVANLFLILAPISIAVAWHRRVILNERPPLFPFNVLSGSFWRYVGIGVTIYLLAMLPMLLAFVLAAVTLSIAGKGAHPSVAFVLIPLILAAYVGAILILLRLSVMLPARAAGDTELSFAHCWRRTRGNAWRIFGGGLICLGAPTMVAEIFLMPMAMPNPATLVAAGPGAVPLFFASTNFIMRMSAVMTFFVVFYLLTLPIGIGFLSFAYRHFFRETIWPAL